MDLAVKALKNDTDPESKPIIKTVELMSHENKKQMKENKEPVMLKTPKFEICISPVEEGRKFEIEVVTDLKSQKKTPKKSSPKISRQLLRDLNCNNLTSGNKKGSKVQATPKKSLSKNGTPGLVDEELKENRPTNEILNVSNNIEPTNNGAKPKRIEKACRKKNKKIESRVSLPEIKRKSLKPISPIKKKGRHTLGILTLECTSEPEKFSPASNPEKTKKITRKRRTKSIPTAQTDDAGIEKLKRVFPNVDPTFLLSQLRETKNNLEDLIGSLKEKEKFGELPLNESYKKKLESERIIQKYIQDFTVQNFIKAIPDPWNYFLNTEIHNSVRYANHSLHYLKNKYKKHYSQTIQETLARCDYSLYKADKELSNKRKNRMLKMRTTNRSKNECDAGKPDNINFQFLQEVVFIENENEIIEEVKKIESAKSKKLKKAKTAGSLLRCQLCFRSDLLWDEAACCSGIHVFCGKCINRYIESEMRKGNFNFKCLLKCEEILSLESIQDVVNPDLMAVIVRRNQLKEMRSSGVENIEFCPYCYHVIIDTSPEQPILSCINPCCLKELCRYCKKPNHIPHECSEEENFENVLETKTDCKFVMCHNCQSEFIKEEDSNKMICSCGSAICFICRLPFSDCPHFISKIYEENSSQQEPDSPKQENFANLSLSKDSPDFLPDFVSSASGTF